MAHFNQSPINEVEVQQAASALVCELDHGLKLVGDHATLLQHLPRVGVALDRLRQVMSKTVWESFCVEVLHRHAFREVFHQDPFTKHSFDQPRGYPGDADLLDYIYGLKLPGDASTALGKAVFGYTTNVPSSRAVRLRRERIAQVIDGLSLNAQPHVAALGAGHLREAELSAAVQAGAIGSLVAIDHDARSLAEIERCHAKSPRNGFLHLREGNVLDLLNNTVGLKNYDLVYAAGLFDYLRQRTATRLCKAMFDMLKPGGKLWIANFAPSLPDIGYMEAFMRWHLVYRHEQEMVGLPAQICPADILQQRVSWDESRCMLFLEITRR